MERKTGRISLKNAWLVLKDQGPPARFIKNLFKGRLRGILRKRSHLRRDGKAKIVYGHLETAQEAAITMQKKINRHFSSYKCLFCDGYHIGKSFWIK